METKIISLNVGNPDVMEWNGKKVTSSMNKKSVIGPLIVSLNNVAGDSFQSSQLHGTPDSVLYAFGLPSILEFMQRIGYKTHASGGLGENLTLEDLDEKEVMVGDVFSIGDVLAQATFPRIPCSKVNIRMQHPDGQKEMLAVGRSGVYLRILQPGRICATDIMKRVSKTKTPSISIHELFRIYRKSMKLEEVERLVKIVGLPQFAYNWLKVRHRELTTSNFS